MEQQLEQSLAHVSDYSIWLLTALAVVWLFAAIYVRITPYKEFELIKAGNAAAALSLGGALLGFSIVLAAVVIHSINYIDLLVWSGVGAVTQIFAYAAVRLSIRDIAGGIERGCIAHGTFLGICSLATGLVTAAAVTP